MRRHRGRRRRRSQGSALEKALVFPKPDNPFCQRPPGLILTSFPAPAPDRRRQNPLMTVAEAEEFTARCAPCFKLRGLVAERSAKAIAGELGMSVPRTSRAGWAKSGPGLRRQPVLPDRPVHDRPLGRGLVDEENKREPSCLLLVYAGVNAIARSATPSAPPIPAGAAGVRPP